MVTARRYRLLCPIARGLDRVGDRWTLLILRDLHAGPARFSDLLSGLKGIASNLLTNRLLQLIDDGLVAKRDAAYGVTVYELTDLGERTRDLLFELAMFGGHFPPDGDVRPPGNLRTIVVTLEAACQRVITPDINLQAELVVDGERFTLIARNSLVKVSSGAVEKPDVILTTAYEPMIAASDGEMATDEFVGKHAEIICLAPGKDAELMTLLGSALDLIRNS